MGDFLQPNVRISWRAVMVLTSLLIAGLSIARSVLYFVAYAQGTTVGESYNILVIVLGSLIGAVLLIVTFGGLKFVQSGATSETNSKRRVS